MIFDGFTAKDNKMDENKDISRIENIIKALSLKDFEDSANSLSEAQKENIKLGKKTLSDYGGVVLSPLTKEAIEIKHAYQNDEISEEQYLDWVDKHKIPQAVFAENIEDFVVTDTTNDYGIFHFNIAIGSNGEGRTVYADMSGYIKDNEADNFEIVTYADDVKNGEMQGYYLNENDKEVFIELPYNVQKMLIECTEAAVIKAETEKIKKEAIWHAEGERTITDDGMGLLCFEDLGGYNGNPIYADFNAEIREDYSILPNHDKGRYYLSPVYNMDKDKAYIIVPNEKFDGGKILFDMPHDILEYCEQKVAVVAYRIKCEELHERLYKNYVRDWKKGLYNLEKETEPMSYKDWLDTAYSNEGYFESHVAPEEAKFLREHDELLSGKTKDDKIFSCYSLTGADLYIVQENNKYTADDVQHYELCDAGIFHEDMDKLISRSEKPELIKQLCEEYDPAAFENCKTYAEFFEAMEEMSVYVGFEVDATEEEPPVVTAYIDIDLPNERISLGQIPLTESETDYVLKAVDRCKEIEVEKLQHNVYEAYKDEWLSENVSAVMQEEAEKEYEEHEEEYASFDDYIEENGYGGSLYVCFEEFLDCEYQDKGWLRSHFNADEAIFLAKNDEFFPFLVYDMSGTTWKDGNSVSVLGGDMVIDAKETKGKLKERD